MNQRVKAYGAAFLFALTIGFSFLGVKVCLEYAQPFDILAHRYMIAAVTALTVRLISKKPLRLKARDLKPIIFLTLFYPILFFLFQTLGLVYLPSIEAGIIQAVGPVFVVFFAYLVLRERVTPRQFIFVLITVAGVVLIFVCSGVNTLNFTPLGTALMVVATLAMSYNTVLTRKLAGKYSVYVLTTMMALSGFVFFSLLAGASTLAIGANTHFFAPFTHPEYVVAIVFLGVASSYLSSFLSIYALSKLQASKMSVFMSLSTVLTIFAGVMFLNESLYWFHIVGTLAVLLGIFGVNLSKHKPTPSLKQEE